MKSATVGLCWVVSLCRVGPVEPGRVDACGAHAEGAVIARPARGSARPAAEAQEQRPTWGARSRQRSARQPLAADRSRGT